MKRPVAFLTTALVVIGLGHPALALAEAKVQSEYARAYRIGLESYTYGLPLLTTNATFLTMTSTDVSQGAYGPVNHFNSVRGANTASSTAVVAPGATSLSSIAWLDLTSGPQVVHVPKVTDRSFVLAFLDPYTTNLVNLGTASKTPPGDYVVRDPSQRNVATPAGTTALDVDYSRIWIIGSTQLKGPGDVAAVNAIQDGYTVTPLSNFVSGTPVVAPTPTSPTVTQAQIPSGLAFFDTLGQLLQKFPPPRRDAATLKRFASVGIGPGLTPSTNTMLSQETVRGLTDAVAAGPARIKSEVKRLFAEDFGRYNGYLLGGFGRYGTNYDKRAVISQIGLGAFTSDQAIYAMTWSDHSGKALTGKTRYVVHLKNPPPTREGWSLTVYNLQGGLIANPLNRYAFTNTSSLARNADGSIDIYIQAQEPTNATQRRNWLPVAGGQGFEVTWRLFAPKTTSIPGILSGTGWTPPSISRR